MSKVPALVIYDATGEPVSVAAQLMCCQPTLMAERRVERSEINIFN
jgi:hypothetical protein